MPSSSRWKTLPTMWRRFPRAGRGEIDAALAVGGKIVRALQRAAVLVLVVGRDRLAVARDAGDRAVVVAGHDQVARAERQHGRRTAAVAFPEHGIFFAVPDDDRVAAIFDVVELAVDDGGPSGKAALSLITLASPASGGNATRLKSSVSCSPRFISSPMIYKAFYGGAENTRKRANDFLRDRCDASA